MESTRFDHSTKDIPLPSERDYKRTLIEKTEHLCRRMRWKAFFYFNPSADRSQKETFGFPSTNSPPQIQAMQDFEKRLLHVIQKIKFPTVNCKFQHKLYSDIRENIMKSDKLLVPADKTSNFYKMDTQSYNDLLQKNITTTYKKVTPDTADSIELKANDIAKKLQIESRINTTAKREAFITPKDHKPNFANNPTCRLINPAKSEIGQFSKQLLDRINTALVSKLELNQWKNTKAVLAWFTSIQHEELHSFIAFHVVEFYPSTFIDLLGAALEFASKHVTICDEERHIAYHFHINYDLNLETAEFLALGLCDFGETPFNARH